MHEIKVEAVEWICAIMDIDPLTYSEVKPEWQSLEAHNFILEYKAHLQRGKNE